MPGERARPVLGEWNPSVRYPGSLSRQPPSVPSSVPSLPVSLDVQLLDVGEEKPAVRVLDENVGDQEEDVAHVAEVVEVLTPLSLLGLPPRSPASAPVPWPPPRTSPRSRVGNFSAAVGFLPVSTRDSSLRPEPLGVHTSGPRLGLRPQLRCAQSSLPAFNAKPFQPRASGASGFHPATPWSRPAHRTVPTLHSGPHRLSVPTPPRIPALEFLRTPGAPLSTDNPGIPSAGLAAVGRSDNCGRRGSGTKRSSTRYNQQGPRRPRLTGGGVPRLRQTSFSRPSDDYPLDAGLPWTQVSWAGEVRGDREEGIGGPQGRVRPERQGGGSPQGGRGSGRRSDGEGSVPSV